MFTFLKAAIRNLKQTGSVIESTPQLAKKMAAIISNKQAVNVIELGAGTGSVTRYILDKITSNSRLMSFELNDELYIKLQELQDERLFKIHDDVQLLEKYASGASVDYIISCLPLANIKTGQKIRILNACLNVLKPGGYYVQFQYSLNDKALLTRKFPSVKLSFEAINIPPAFIYYAQK